MTEEQKSEERIPEEQKPQATKAEAPQEPAAPRVQENSTSRPSMVGRALRWIFRMLVTILFGIGLGAGLYYGARNFYQDAIEPLQTIDQRVLEVEASVSELGETVRESRTSTAEQISELQGDLSSQAEQIASLEAQIERLETQLEVQAEELEQITAIRDDLDQIREDLTDNLESLRALEEVIAAGELPAERAREALQLMRIMNLMTRARLWIEQDNYGLASEDIQAALEIIEPLAAEADPESEKGSQLQEIADRLTVAGEIVRSNPVLAAEELEIVWKLLLGASAP